jgi:predicted site-specific integrase-resolvase
MDERDPGADRLLKPAEVAAIFCVDPKTVAVWAKTGRLRAIRTLGGHRRYRESEVLSLVREDSSEVQSEGGQQEPEAGA